jgi:hypothetical protein
VTTILLAAAPAGAVVKRTSYSLGSYTVGLVSAYYCSGVVIARRAVVTAAHCGRGMRVIAAGRSFHVRHVGRSTVLDDGRRVQVRGDAAILELAESLPANIAAAPVGEGAGDSFTIAGYGTTSERERWRGRFGALHEAHLVSAGDNMLVDPNRSGNVSASVCFGDSGGLVLRGGMVVGVITRTAHPPAHRLRRSDALGTDPHYRRGRSRGRDGRAADRRKGAPASPSPPHAPGPHQEAPRADADIEMPTDPVVLEA